MAKHDPQARRQAIIRAAADLIAEVGPGKLTHRLVAARADVPLGSTTAYFTSIDDLRQAALAHHVADIDTTLAQIADEFRTDPVAAPDRLVDALHDYLSDQRSVASATALNATATFDPQVRELARAWTDGIIGALAEHIGHDNALAVALIADGACVHAAIRGEPVDKQALRRAFTPFITFESSQS
ncbi:DNA-binding transcriptional regulator [Gordonia spumicola]|uniref:DNA-binding transcriptional regulator n=1 Tax=Gordonia spumicola TaxID=589161 RepID=A0A7I9V667_9ACTN|nr:TetR family transcriptional regulator [Gordonia spumicola]GEE00551.1 DNA-binding transcriptional regulator [Gordonia spumicola]